MKEIKWREIGKVLKISLKDWQITCKYRNWSAAGDSEITSEASAIVNKNQHEIRSDTQTGEWSNLIYVYEPLRARDAFCSPSAAITLALASLAASAYD